MTLMFGRLMLLFLTGRSTTREIGSSGTAKISHEIVAAYDYDTRRGDYSFWRAESAFRHVISAFRRIAIEGTGGAGVALSTKAVPDDKPALLTPTL